MIQPAIEKQVHDFLHSYCTSQAGVYYLASNGTEDHVHMLLQIEPTVTISDFVGKIKGASSYEINRKLGRNTLHWQRGYGVVSFARLNLPGLKKYVENQKEHHSVGTCKPVLEIFDAEMENAKAYLQAR
jgi:putative transposase